MKLLNFYFFGAKYGKTEYANMNCFNFIKKSTYKRLKTFISW